MMDVDELASKAAPFNPRVLSKAARVRLEASLREFGMAGTIVFNSRTQTVLGGHQRLSLLQEARVQRVAVTTVDVPAEKEAALCIQLNREDSMGSWDRTKLDELLSELASGSADLLADLKLTEMAEYRASDPDALLQKILTEREYQPQANDPDPQQVAEALADKVRALPPAALRGALLIAVPLNGRGSVLVLADPDHQDFVAEIRRAHDAGEGPMEALFASIV
jgi:hypothetical protein